MNVSTNGVYTKVIFFDRYGDVLEENWKMKVFDFTYLIVTYTSLAKCWLESLDFYSFLLKNRVKVFYQNQLES